MLVRAWVVGRLGGGGGDREPGHGVAGAEGALEDGVVEGGGGVVELLGEDALEDEAVGGGPGGRVGAGQAEQGGPVAGAAGLGEVVVEAGGEGEGRLWGRAGGGGGGPLGPG